MFPSWCRTLLQSVLNNNSQARTRRLTPLGSPRRFCRPRLEQFEDRIVPTTVSIPTNLTGVQGGIVTVPVNVDTLSDPAHGTSGLSLGEFIVYYNPAILSVSNADLNLGTIATPTAADPTGTGVGDGYGPSAPNGWGVVPLTFVPGYLYIVLGNSAGVVPGSSTAGNITNTGGGSLVTINFHIAANAPLGPTAVDLAADSFGSPPSTNLYDQNGSAYALGPNGLGPQDNTTLNPYSYTGSDPDDGSVIITAAAAMPHFVVTAAPTTITAGSPVSFTVTAEDQNGNTLTGYAGTVHFTSTDAAATFPANSTLTAGVGTFSVTLKTAGNQTLSATDTISSTITATSNAVTVSPAAATHFAVTGMPANTMAGVPFNVTVTAQDQFNNTVTGFSGSVLMSSSDSQAVLPAGATLTSGVGAFSVTLKTAGSQTLTATSFAGSGFVQAPGSPITVNGAGNRVVVGDFNGDGKLDFAAEVGAAGTNQTINIFPGNGDGTFSAGQVIGVGSCQAMAVGDLSGNGKLDLAYINAITADTVNVLLGNGNGTFRAGATYALPYPAPTSGNFDFGLAAADVTGDGKLDLVVTGSSNPVNNQLLCYAAVFLGNGDGTFKPAITSFISGAPSPFFPYLVTVADLIPGGKPDLVVSDTSGASGDPPVIVLLGNGNGTFAAPVSVGVGPAAGLDVAVGDFNGDGIPDLAVANELTNSVSIMLGNGNGTFGLATTFAVGAADPYYVVAADVNGDGKLDLIVTSTANQTPNTVSILLGNGNGTFGSPQTITVGSYPRMVAVGDFNGDGAPDLVVPNFDSDNITILLHTGITLSGSARVSVGAAAASLFTVTAPITATAGSPTTVTVIGFDHYGNAVTSYSGTVHFTSSDGQAGLPGDQVLTSGVGKFAVTLKTAGNQTITATDTASSSITGTSSAITVSAGAVSRYSITGAPSSIIAGIGFKVTLNIQDAYGNAVTSYHGAAQFTSSDGQAVLPGNTSFKSGATFSVTLETAGSQTLTATDLSTASLTDTVTVTVNPAAAAHLSVAAPNTITAGHPLVFVVTAEDPFNNIVKGYAGTVHFTSSDGRAILADDGTLTGGTGFFAALLETAGSQTITATDTVTNTFTGISNPVIVSAGPFNHLGVTVPATAVTGNPFAFTVTALDAFNNPAPTYTGTVHFTSSDSGATLPPNSTLTGGVGAFTATLLAPGSQTITANDTISSSITGTAAVAARGLVVNSFSPTSTGFVATFDKPFNPTQLNLYNSAVGPAGVTLTGPSGAVRGSLLLDPTDTTITFVKTSTFTGSNFDPSTGLLALGTYTATFRSASNGFKDLTGSFLDGNNSGVPGTNYVATFVVNSTGVAVGIPSFARGPDGSQNINLPNNAGSVGIPVNLSNGAGVTSGQFTLQYNSALLNITGVTVNSALTGATLTLAPTSTAGNAVIDFSTTGTLSSSVVRLGGLVGTVPNSAASSYKDKALLHFASATVNGGAIAVVGDDAVQIVAYPGDVAGTGTYSPLDAALISSVASGLATGFPAYALLDPVIVGDPSGNGAVDSADVTLMNAILSGRSELQVPPIPTGLTIVPTGPDPTLSLGRRTELIPFYASPGSTMIVPVNIDTARPSGSTGMTEAILALRFNPLLFTVSAADVDLGTLPSAGSGWHLQTVVNNQTGEIGIDLFSTAPIQSSAGGSLVTIALQVRETAPAGSTELSIVPQVNPTGRRVYETMVADTQGALVVHVAAAGTEPGEGSVWVTDLTPATAPISSKTDLLTAGTHEPGLFFGLMAGNGGSLLAYNLPAGEQILATAFGSTDTGELQQAYDVAFETWAQSPNTNDYAVALILEAGVDDRPANGLAEDLGNSTVLHLGTISDR